MDESLLNEDIPTNEEAELIKPIDKSTVHRICSGQVVLSLAIAVKELVENAIDAGATIINIRLKEYGSELIEVTDNGGGVLESNLEGLTLKHYTSKIRQFSDVATVQTLGFRGEALSSLCALSDMEIVTKHTSTELGTKLKYDKNGIITFKEKVARQTGTTVSLENIFSSLPVRRKEFLKNLKKEYNKMCQLLNAYCLVSKGIKFTCTNTTKNGSKNIVISTEGKKSINDNIVNVFGAKQISNLIEVPLKTPTQEILDEFGCKNTELFFTFEFFISSVVHGHGRSSNDRQFYYMNSRPCEPNKLIKLVNTIYKQFNNLQFPFVYLNISIKSNAAAVDVNVTPDKRQIFIENEKLLLATVKTSLLEVFQQFPSTFKMQNMDISKSFLNKSDRGVKRVFSENLDKKFKSGSILEAFRKRSKTEIDQTNSFNETIDFLPKIEDFTTNSQKSNNIFNNSVSPEKSKSEKVILEESACKLLKNNSEISEVVPITQTSIKDNEAIPEIINVENIVIDDDSKKSESQTKISVNTTFEQIKLNLNKIKAKHEKSKQVKIKFRSEMNPESNEKAEKELRQISKLDFARMEIIGQFNLGFIVTKLDNDLFIVDQHASDEKYNFEQLQANTVLENQKLINPKLLELTAGNEEILIENEEIFKLNGFTFKIDPTAPSTKKVYLTAIPLSKNIVFGKDDIDEMLFLLKDSNKTMCRPSRVRAMFASRACRKSVMIGKALNKSEMRRLIDHMGEIDQPWNCPHGRPTMRHLINLDLIDANL